MQKGIKILIVEDEVLISERLKQIVQGFGHQVISICGSLSDVKKLPLDISPDIALLDIRMNGKNEGEEVAKIMKSHNIPFIFITSFSDKKTLQSTIILNPVGYIVKPFTAIEIKTVLDAFIANQAEKFLELKSNNKFQKIPLDSIKWINSENIYIEIFCKTEKIVERMKLSDIEALLPKSKFIRIHQSHILNIDYVNKYDKTFLWIDNQKFPISKKYKTIVNKTF